MLAGGQEWLSQHFARSVPPIAMWHGIAHHEGSEGAPLLAGALGWLECRLWAEYPAGDHTLFVGEVLAAELGEDAPPLVHVGSRLPRARVTIEAVVFDLDGVLARQRADLGRGARAVRPRAGRALRRRRAAGDDGHELERVVALHPRAARRRRPRRTRSTPTSSASCRPLPRAPAARCRARERRWSAWRRSSRSRSHHPRTGR